MAVIEKAFYVFISSIVYFTGFYTGITVIEFLGLVFWCLAVLDLATSFKESFEGD